jgi:broad specificity phosphatase PhoE
MGPDATHFLLIRHAHVDLGPPPGVLCGSLDLPLSAAGRAQLGALRTAAIDRIRPTALYSSTLRRARETAAALAGVWSLDVHLDAALREIDCGSLEGRSLRDIEHDFAELWAANRAQRDDDFTWPGGESYRAFRARVAAAFTALAARHRGERVAIVTHAGVISQAFGILRGRPPAVWDADRPDVLSSSEIVWADGAPAALLSFNGRAWDPAAPQRA